MSEKLKALDATVPSEFMDGLPETKGYVRLLTQHVIALQAEVRALRSKMLGNQMDKAYSQGGHGY